MPYYIVTVTNDDDIVIKKTVEEADDALEALCNAEDADENDVDFDETEDCASIEIDELIINSEVIREDINRVKKQIQDILDNGEDLDILNLWIKTED